MKKHTAYALGFLTTIAIVGLYLFLLVFGKSLRSTHGENTLLFTIPTGSTTESIQLKLDSLYDMRYQNGFSLVSSLVNLDEHIHPGLYRLHEGMSNKDLVLLFRSGRRETVDFTINFARFADDVLKQASEKLEATYSELQEKLYDPTFLDSLGLTKETAVCLFIPDTYEFYWNTSADKFLARMAKEYAKFWNENRRKRAHNIGLTPHEVMTLASIINQETHVNSEKRRIAGVYMNRLTSNQTAGKLQADPTIKFALKDFGIKRILKGHIERAKTSPYSTYEHPGLPPGPICTPSKIDIDAVLNYEKHSYLYFCAQPNYSGKSDFSTTYSQHLQKAQQYQRWLDSEGYSR